MSMDWRNIGDLVTFPWDGEQVEGAVVMHIEGDHFTARTSDTEYSNVPVASVVDLRPRGRSKHHDWTKPKGSQDQYDSLTSRGRSLYDSLRTNLGWGHKGAYAVAMRSQGLRDD